jgi:hypothetical protein
LKEQPASSSSGEISTPPPCGLLIGIYRFYENWSTETFSEEELKKWVLCYTQVLRERLIGEPRLSVESE